MSAQEIQLQKKVILEKTNTVGILNLAFVILQIVTWSVGIALSTTEIYTNEKSIKLGWIITSSIAIVLLAYQLISIFMASKDRKKIIHISVSFYFKLFFETLPLIGLFVSLIISFEIYKESMLAVYISYLVLNFIGLLILYWFKSLLQKLENIRLIQQSIPNESSLQDYVSKVKFTSKQPLLQEDRLFQNPSLYQRNKPKKLIRSKSDGDIQLNFESSQKIDLKKDKKPKNMRYYTHFHHFLWAFVYLLISVTINVCYYQFDWENTFSTGTVLSINLLINVVIRCETLISFFHFIAIHIPFQKYFFNRMVHSIGGIHIGSGIYTFIWLFQFDITLKDPSLLLKIVTLTIFSFIIMIIITAIPSIRESNHNLFEKFHRYIGWATTALLLFLVIYKEQVKYGYTSIFENTNVILTFVATFFIIHPWFFVKRVKVTMSAPSKSCTMLTMHNIKQKNYHGRALKIAVNCSEWHAFAIALTYPEEQKINSVVAAAGDWTKAVINFSQENENKVTKMWIRRIFSTGFMYSIKAYKKVMIVATGSGIAPVLPYLQNPVNEIFVLWIGSNHESTFGEFINSLVQEGSNYQYQIWDTKKQGRPSAYQVFQKFQEINKNILDKKQQYEAAFVVSNKKFTHECVYEFQKNGGHSCYGAMFDS